MMLCTKYFLITVCLHFLRHVFGSGKRHPKKSHPNFMLQLSGNGCSTGGESDLDIVVVWCLIPAVLEALKMHFPMGTPQSVLRAVQASPLHEVAMATSALNERVEKWRTTGIFDHQDQQAVFEIRLRILNRVLAWPNARESYCAYHNLIQTWKDEERWEAMVQKEIEDNKADAARSGGYA